MAHPSKGGAAKLKAYVVGAQRASAGEAYGVGGSIEAPQYLCPAIWLLSCRSF